jgi:hypothetical protein
MVRCHVLFADPFSVREKEHVLMPMPGVVQERAPLRELVPIKVVAGSSWDRGKSRGQAEMDKGAIKKA